jgi:hypothetical protein
MIAAADSPCAADSFYPLRSLRVRNTEPPLRPRVANPGIPSERSFSDLPSLPRVGVYVDAENIRYNGGYQMRYDVLRNASPHARTASCNV